MKRMLRPVSNFDKWAKEEETAKDLRGRKIKTMSFHRSQDKWQFQGKKKKKICQFQMLLKDLVRTGILLHLAFD